MDKHLSPAKIALLYAAFAGLWIFASDQLLALAVTDPDLLVQIGLFKGITFVIVTALLLYLLLKTRTAQADAPDAAEAPRLRSLVAIFLCLALIVPLFGAGVAKLYGPRVQQNAFNDLTAIAELKTGQIEAWLQERHGDANELTERYTIIEMAERWLSHGDAKAKAYVLARMNNLSRAHDYETVLLDTDGLRALASDAAPEDSISAQVWQELLPLALSSGEIQRSELYRDGLGNIRLDYLVPLRLPNPQRTVGFMVLRAPVEQFLFPLIQSWPSASPSAETVLTRRDGDHVLFLNELRHRRGTALSLRLPLTDTLPAAVSIHDDQLRTMNGSDYRGVRVLAATHPIAGTDWHLVAKVDEAEVMALLDNMLFWVGLVAIIAVVVVASAVLLLWRQHQRMHRMELLARTTEQDRQLKLFYDLPFIGMGVSSPTSNMWLYTNDRLCDMLGYTRDELKQITWIDLTHPDDLAACRERYERMTAGEIDSFKMEKRFVRKDGQPISVNIDVKCTRAADGHVSHILMMVEDITERKQSEIALHQAATVFESSHDGVTITDPDGNILAVNDSFLRITGYSKAEVLGKNPRILHSGRQSKDFYLKMWADIKEAGFWQGEIWNRRKNGEIYPERLTISAVKDARGETTHYVGMFTDLSQLKQSEAQREHLAHYDPLTDLPNRLLVQSHLAHTLGQAQRYQRQVGVLYLDLDRFKTVNDSLGYPVGDELLVALVKRLTSRMRGEDMLARLGGDEFLLVLDHIDSPDAAAGVARSLLELLTQAFALSCGQEIFIGASIGISVFPDDGNSSDTLIQHADAAMHQAKQQGRNTYRFYIDSLTRAAGAHLELETRLRHAISANQLRVYYQPQVDIASGRIIGAEALVRWEDPERGLIAPIQFIPLAEETGLIGAIGEWVLKETCLQGVRWIEAGLPFLTLAVNLSPHQFMRGNIAELVGKVLAETGFPAGRLELELTESALMEQEEEAVKMLHLLRAQNIRLAIDDFGTGYSSLSYLKRFPLDILKIDKSFVDDIPFQQDDMEIAAAIIAMGHTLGFKVLAEGVETTEQLDFLQSKGCDMYQGYLTTPPIPAEEFEKLLSARHA